MEGTLERQLVEGCRALGLEPRPELITQLDRYLDLLRTWNRKINLTAISDPAQVIERHFLDSLAPLALIDGVATLVDIGTGAGFPGAVLALGRPDLRVTCVEPVHKKVAFLQTLRAQLVPNLEVRCARIEQLGAVQFDAAISRATWAPTEWLVHGAPLVKAGGLLLAMQTADQDDLETPSGFVRLPPRLYQTGQAIRRIQAFRRQDSP